MGKKLSPHDEELYRRTDEVLHYVWDPIGVAEAPPARDEYYSYLPQVFGLLKKNANIEQIADYLFQVSTENMGLNGNRKHDLRVAEVLLDWKRVIGENTPNKRFERDSLRRRFAPPSLAAQAFR